MKSIGIDIGGTKMAVAVVDPRGEILARTTMRTEAELGFARAVERLTLAIREVLVRAGCSGDSISGIGVGCAGPVDPVRGLINNPYTLAGWDRCNIIRPLEEQFDVPVLLENDADAALLGECWRGAGQGLSHVVMLTLGTGVGGAALMGGRLVRGRDGEHPEFGHMPVWAEGPRCYCGTRGCLESLASGTAITDAGRKAGYESAQEVFDAAARQDARAREILDRAADAVATAAWTVFHTFLPQRLILGGGVAEKHFETFATAVQQRLGSVTQFSYHGGALCRAETGNDAGLIGAAQLCLPNHELNPTHERNC